MWPNEWGTLTGLAVFCRSEAHFALAAVAAWSIQTLSVLTQVHVVCTLIHVWNRTDECILNMRMESLSANIKVWFMKKVSAVLPEHENPSPLKPLLHVHLYDPGVLTQSALGLQLWSSREHSSWSAGRVRGKCCESYTLCQNCLKWRGSLWLCCTLFWLCIMLLSCRNMYLPTHLMPSPTQPSRQRHLKLPGTLMHAECMSQLWASISHSSTSGEVYRSISQYFNQAVTHTKKPDSFCVKCSCINGMQMY